MPTRRDFLLTGTALVVIRTPAWGIEADNATLRYRNWLGEFQSDMKMLSASEAGAAGASEEKVSIICENSVVADSRAALMISEWIKEADEKRDARHGARRYADMAAVAMLLFEHSVPAGYGGLFQEAPGSRFPSGRFSVWYMHIGGPDDLQAYFDDKAQFPNYELPPNGILKRHAYPFLLFEDVGNTLRLAGVGAEWMGAAVYLHRKQYS